MSIIWLPLKNFPNNQHTKISRQIGQDNTYSVVQFSRTFSFSKNIKKLNLKAVADTVFYLYCNSKLVINSGMKPAVDYWQTNYKLDTYYWAKKTLEFKADTKDIAIRAFVQLYPSVDSDFSCGAGGFLFEGEIIFEDDTKEIIKSDENWDCVLDNRFNGPSSFNNLYLISEIFKAEKRSFDWKVLDPHFNITIEEAILHDTRVSVEPGENKDVVFELDKIYSSFVELECSCQGIIKGNINCFETKNFNSGKIDFLFTKNDKVRFFDLKSIGLVIVHVENNSSFPATLNLNINFSHYGYGESGSFRSENIKLDDLMEKCKFCGINCSQSYYLDSPKHQEPFASCSGDYQIISLVEGFATGDYALAKHVLEGYFRALEIKKGFAANGNYGLVAINWLWEIYMITGDNQLLKSCLNGANSVIELFTSYLGKKGIIENPETFSFMDWLEIDGYNLFSPPAALGQTVTNMYYCHALESISNIYKILGERDNFTKFRNLFKKTRRLINKYFYDRNKKLYFEGLNDPLPKDYKPVHEFHRIPENALKRYYLKHSNALAVAFGIAKKVDCRNIVRKIFTELKNKKIQPYFSHYTYQAIHKAGLDRQYAILQTNEWLKHVKLKDKGLPEGFYKPSKDYKFDYSHAWACSPYYSLIVAASGIEILEPGMKKIKLKPSTLGFAKLEYQIGTPYGFISINHEKDKKPIVTLPDEISILE